MPVAHTTVEVDATPAQLMGVIVDFAAYPQFVADMQEATILRHEGDEWVVRFVIKVIRRIEYTLRLIREDDLHLTWTMVDGAFKSNNGGWALEPIAGGTRATYTLELEIGTFIPGSVLKTLLEHNLPATMAAFKQRAEQQGGLAPR